MIGVEDGSSLRATQGNPSEQLASADISAACRVLAANGVMGPLRLVLSKAAMKRYGPWLAENQPMFFAGERITIVESKPL